MKLFTVIITFILFNSSYAQENYSIDSIKYMVNCSSSLVKIDFIYLDWRYNPPGTLSEYNVRTNNEIEKMRFSVTDSISIYNIYNIYCDEGNNKRIESEHFSVRLIMDLHFVDGTIKSILMDYYFEFDDKSEHNFRNYKLMKSIVETVPNTHAFDRHKIGN
jgi:hypothetical protein